jgi:hypothetical protein
MDAEEQQDEREHHRVPRYGDAMNAYKRRCGRRADASGITMDRAVLMTHGARLEVWPARLPGAASPTGYLSVGTTAATSTLKKLRGSDFEFVQAGTVTTQ